MNEGELFKRCRTVLGLSKYDAVNGPLSGIISERRLRKVEKGQEDVPPRAWLAFSRLLIQGDLLVGSDLLEQVAIICERIKPLIDQEENWPLAKKYGQTGKEQRKAENARLVEQARFWNKLRTAEQKPDNRIPIDKNAVRVLISTSKE